MKALVLAAFLVFGLVTPACTSNTATTTSDTNGAVPTGDAKEVGVEVRSFSIQPDTLNVSPGQRVRFTVTNTSTIFHTFTLATGSDKQEMLVDMALNGEDSESQEITVPTSATTLYFFCRPHEAIGMKGSFSVGGSQAVGGDQNATPILGSSDSEDY